MKEKGKTIRKVRKILIWFLSIISGLCILGVLTGYITFNFFSTRILKEIIREKIYSSSQGLYTVDFSELKINILTRDVSIIDFSLIPDTNLYMRMKLAGTAKSALYKISYRELRLHRLNFREIYLNRRIHLGEMFIIRPEINLMAFPDTIAVNKGRFRNIYEDVYPLASKIFREVHVDSVIIERGKILSSREGKTGHFTLGRYEFSAILRDFAINPYSYFNKQRVFYSHDIDFRVYNVQYSLADSLYFLRAKEIGFSVMKSHLFGKSVSLKPNFKSKRLMHASQGDFFQVDIPEFYIEGINLYEALTGRKAHVKKVELRLSRVKVFHNTSSEALAVINGTKKRRRPINRVDLYTIISGKLSELQIDSMVFREASLEYFKNLSDPNPELRVGGMNIRVDDFRLDSLQHLRKNRIFFSRDLDLDLHDITLALRDQIHVLNAGKVYLSTKKHLLRVQEAILFPDEKKNLEISGEKKDIYYLLVPELTFSNIDLTRAFYRQELKFTNLFIESPDIRFTRYRQPSTEGRRFKKPEDLFREENEDALYVLLKKYVNLISSDTILVRNGFLSLFRHTDSTERKISSGSFNLGMYEFLVDSVHKMNEQGYFYSHDFDLELKSFTYSSPDSLRNLVVDRLHISTKDSLIDASGFSFRRLQKKSAEDPGKIYGMSVNFTTDQIHLQGLNHKKLFLEKILYANTLTLSNPSVSLKAGDPEYLQISSEDLRITSSQNLVKYLEIGKLQVRKADLSFDALEQERSSYFKLKDLDFAVRNLHLKLPDRRKLNGAVRFDSITLSVMPFRMIVLDSTYEVRCDKISLNSYPLNILIRGMDLVPIEPVNGRNRNKTRVNVSIPELSIRDFYFDKALFSRQWIIGKINMKGMRSLIFAGSSGSPKQTKKIPLAIRYDPSLGSFRIDSIILNDAEIKVSYPQKDKRKSISLEKLQLALIGFKLDSIQQAGNRDVPLFNSKDIRLSAKGMSLRLPDSLYTFSFRKFRLSTAGRILALDSLSLLPEYSRDDFNRKCGFQNDRLVLMIPELEIRRIDFPSLISNRNLLAGCVMVSRLMAECYRDKRFKTLKDSKRPMLQDRIRSIGFPLAIDTVIVKDGSVRYEEQLGELPGYVFFDRINSVLLNFSNMPSVWEKYPVLSLSGTSLFMGKSRMNGNFRLVMNHPRDSVNWNAVIDSVDLQDVNPMVTRLLPAKIIHGFVEQARVKSVCANDKTAVGHFEVKYHNLYVEYHPVTEGSFRKLKNALITDLANLILPDDNPNKRGKFRKGIIYFHRDTTKGFPNFVWKSSLSGLKSTVGFNSPEQKEIKKMLRRQAK